MSLNVEAGVADAKTTRASCTALNGDTSFVTVYEDRANTCLICASQDWTPFVPGATAIAPGTYEDKGGWGIVVLAASGGGLAGTYTGAYEADTGAIKFVADGAGGYRGEWSEPEIGRSGVLENVVIAKDGKSFSADWRSTVAGERRHASGTSTFTLK
ncbi:MAG: hypothetical protein AAGC56_00030 [Pseudomonadota bacterium]